MRKHTLIITLTVVIGLSFLTSWGVSKFRRNKGVNKTTPVEKTTLAYVNTTHAVLAGIALQKGYFLEEGLEVTPREHSFGKSTLDDMLQGNADFATVADPPIMMAIMKDMKISVIATIQTSNKDNAIIALKKSGILKPSDLKGRRISSTRTTTSDFFMDAFLVANEIGYEDVKKINLKPEQLQDALVKGQVDAVSAFQPFLLNMQMNLGDQIVSFYDENIYTWTFNIVAKQEFIRKNPETVKKLLRALLKAEQFVKQNDAEARKIVSDYSGMSLDQVRAIWPHMRFAVTLDQFLVLALEDESLWALNSGMIKKRNIPNFLNYFYFDGLESVNPDAIRILGRKPTD